MSARVRRIRNLAIVLGAVSLAVAVVVALTGQVFGWTCGWVLAALSCALFLDYEDAREAEGTCDE